MEKITKYTNLLRNLRNNSKKVFEEWDDIFGGETVAVVIFDRLLHHSYPFFINGKSYRIKPL
jgi:DNA replication protein DnaC